MLPFKSIRLAYIEGLFQQLGAGVRYLDDSDIGSTEFTGWTFDRGIRHGGWEKVDSDPIQSSGGYYRIPIYGKDGQAEVRQYYSSSANVHMGEDFVVLDFNKKEMKVQGFKRNFDAQGSHADYSSGPQGSMKDYQVKGINVNAEGKLYKFPMGTVIYNYGQYLKVSYGSHYDLVLGADNKIEKYGGPGTVGRKHWQPRTFKIDDSKKQILIYSEAAGKLT